MSIVTFIRFAIIVATLVVWTIALAPIQWLLLRELVLRHLPAGATRLPHLYHIVVSCLLGFRITQQGQVSGHRPLLLIANHISWADIVILSAIAPVSFIAKAEMITWPIFGWLARAQRTIFVDRADRRRANEQADRIARRLEAGDIMVLFPEGTTSDGTRILDFNASLLGAAANVVRRGVAEDVHVQPVALNYTRLHGIPLGRIGMRRVGWPGAVPLMPHLPDTIRSGGLDVTVSFGTAVRFDTATRRRDVSAAARQAIRDMRVGDA